MRALAHRCDGARRHPPRGISVRALEPRPAGATIAEMVTTTWRCLECPSILVLALAGACGAVEAPASWTPSCAPGPQVTDVETGDPAYSTGCIHGTWTLLSPNGVTVPVTAGKAAAVKPTVLGAGGNPLDMASRFAVHVTGNGQQSTATVTSYAHVTATLNTLSSAQTGTVDASAYQGIQFDAIVNTGPAGAKVNVGTLYSEPQGGMCSTASDAPAMTGCYDRPGAQLAVSTAWTRYQVPFDGLRPTGFGTPSPTGAAFPRAALVVVEWAIVIPATGPAPAWELWIDDLGFY
jgi:hypothetical protein